MPDAASDPPGRHLDQARAQDRAACVHRDLENRRRAGVAWSGLSDTPLAPLPEAELRAAAQARLAAARAWSEQPQGSFVGAIAAAQRCAERLHAGAEQARAAAARGLAGERVRCGALVRDLRRQARELAAGLRAAEAALRRLDHEPHFPSAGNGSRDSSCC